MDLSKKLNDRQQFAAETLDGPVLILAGAGSGKTRTLTYRVANLIEHVFRALQAVRRQVYGWQHSIQHVQEF